MRHRVEYVVVRWLTAVVRFMPFGLVDRCGALLGLTFFVIDGTHRRVASRNVAAAFPRWSAARQRQVVRAAFEHFNSASGTKSPLPSRKRATRPLPST